MNENTIGSSCIKLHCYSNPTKDNSLTLSTTETINNYSYLTDRNEIEKFIKENTEKLKINRNGENIDLYLKTKSKIALGSCIIDVNGDISLNYESTPEKMNWDWIQEKKLQPCMSIYTTDWNYSCTKLQKYKGILNVLKPSEFNYYKVNVNIDDIVGLYSYKVKVKKMTINSEILITPKFSYEIYDVEKDGSLSVTIKNNLTNKVSNPFSIELDSEEEISTAISKELNRMAVALELGNTKGEIEITEFSKNVQNYIKAEE